MASTEPKQTGGKRIGRGRYGCVFDPPLLCIKKTKSGDTHLVGKLTNEKDAEKEIEISKRLDTIPDAKRYFILIEDHCKPKPRAQQKDPDIQRCPPAAGEKYTSMLQILMPYAGRTLHSIPKRSSNLDFFRLGQHLLEAGTYLLLKGIVHLDLHSQNIVTTNPFTPKILDFGAAYIPSGLNVLNYRQVLRSYNPAVSQEPPEMTVINALESNVSTNVALAGILEQKDTLHFITGLTDVSSQDQIERLRRFLRTSKSFQERNWMAFFKVFWTKVDAWGIGSLLVDLYTNLALDPTFDSLQTTQDKSPLAIKVIAGLCDMDPGMRLDCAEALALWAPESEVLKQQDVKTWLAEQGKQRAALLVKTST